jgi:hypothetical protein
MCKSTLNPGSCTMPILLALATIRPVTWAASGPDTMATSCADRLGKPGTETPRSIKQQA